MATATATKTAKAEKTALLDEYVALAQAKLGMDVTDKDSLKALGKKSPADLVIQIGRLGALRDFNAAPAAPEAAVWTPEPQRASSNGNGVARRPAAPKVSQAKLDYAASLLIEMWGEDEAAELIAELGNYDGEHISRMIDSLKLIIPISEGQTRFARELYSRKFKEDAELRAAFEATLETMTKVEAKQMLDMMQDLPDVPREQQAPGAAPEVEADGMYRNPETGEIFKVQIAHHGSGKLYAKKLVKLDEPTTVRGKEAHFAFEMARGAIMTIKPEWQLTREDAKEFGDLYGCCMRCGTVLTDEASIERGMGPVCYDKM